MNTGFKIYVVGLTVAFLFSCSKSIPPEPSCRVDANHISNRTGAAACVIVLNQNLLVTRIKNEQYNLAIAPANENNAQCNAHQAIWQQTGMNVEVGQVLAIHNDGTWLFSCELNAGFDGTEKIINAPYWSPDDVSYMSFIDPFDYRIEDWHIPDHFIVTRDAFVAEIARQRNQKQ